MAVPTAAHGTAAPRGQPRIRTPDGTGWSRLIDTNLPDVGDEPRFEIGGTYDAAGRSFLLFLLQAEGR